jgi:hypothetical protein
MRKKAICEEGGLFVRKKAIYEGRRQFAREGCLRGRSQFMKEEGDW